MWSLHPLLIRSTRHTLYLVVRFLSANKKGPGSGGRGRRMCEIRMQVLPHERSKELRLVQPDVPHTSLFPNLALNFTCITRTVMNFSASPSFLCFLCENCDQNDRKSGTRSRETMMMIMMMAWDELMHCTSVVALNTCLMRLTFCYLFNGMHTPSPNLGSRVGRYMRPSARINTLTGG